MSFSLTGNFFSHARGIAFADGGGITWSFNKNTNTISAVGDTASGTVTSVGFVDGSTVPIYTVTNSPVTTSGNLTITLNTQTAHYALMGPISGSAAQPTFRALVATDVPTLNQNTTGNAATATTATNLAGGAAGSIPYQTALGETSLLATASGVLVGGTTPAWSTTPTLTGTNFSGIPYSAMTGTVPTWNQNTTGNAATATSATTATNIAGGAAGSIPYQTGSGATSLLATASGVLVAGSPPSWSTAPTLTGTNFSGIPNGALSNSSLTVTAGTGMSGGGSVSLGGSVTLTNAGVTSNVSGTGVSVSSATGAVTISIGQSVATTATPTFAGVVANSAPLATNFGPTTAWQVDFSDGGGTNNQISLANNATTTLSAGAGLLIIGGYSFAGIALIGCGNGSTGVYNLYSSSFSNTSGNAGTINIYYSGSNNQYIIQNKSGSTATMCVGSLRLY